MFLSDTDIKVKLASGNELESIYYFSSLQVFLWVFKKILERTHQLIYLYLGILCVGRYNNEFNCFYWYQAI